MNRTWTQAELEAYTAAQHAKSDAAFARLSKGCEKFEFPDWASAYDFIKSRQDIHFCDKKDFRKGSVAWSPKPFLGFEEQDYTDRVVEGCTTTYGSRHVVLIKANKR